MKPQKYKAKSKLFTKTKRRRAVIESANVPVAESLGKLSRSGPTCVNCDQKFRERSDGRGFFRFSVEKTFPCGKVAMELLTNITGVPFSTRTKRGSIDGQFLCPACWQLANKIGWYMDSFSEFRARSSPSSYIGRRNASFRHQATSLATTVKEEAEDHSYSAGYAEDNDVDDMAAVPPKKMKQADADSQLSTKYIIKIGLVSFL